MCDDPFIFAASEIVQNLYIEYSIDQCVYSVTFHKNDTIITQV